MSVSAFGYQGQKCSACSRAIVDAAVYDEFLDKLSAEGRERSQWVRPTIRELYGPVISAGAKQAILQYIESGQAGRAPGGRRRPRREAKATFVQPTVIADVDSKARIFQEEIFGPVLAVAKARDFDHAWQLANDSEYGLTGAVYSNNPETSQRHARSSSSAICTSTGNAPARWWAPTRSAASTCRARIPRRAARTTCRLRPAGEVDCRKGQLRSRCRVSVWSP